MKSRAKLIEQYDEEKRLVETYLREHIDYITRENKRCVRRTDVRWVRLASDGKTWEVGFDVRMTSSTNGRQLASLILTINFALGSEHVDHLWLHDYPRVGVSARISYALAKAWVENQKAKKKKAA
jgi:hypothetical protein